MFNRVDTQQIKRFDRSRYENKWLDRQSVNGTVLPIDYDPDFNIQEVLDVLEDEEAQE